MRGEGPRADESWNEGKHEEEDFLADVTPAVSGAAMAAEESGGWDR